MLLRLPDALHFSVPSKGACNTQHLKHSGTASAIFFFFLAMPSAIFSLQEFRLDSAWHRQELPAHVPGSLLFFQPSSAEVQISAAPDLAQGLAGSFALGTVISEAAAWDLAAGKGLALLRLPPHQEENQS